MIIHIMPTNPITDLLVLTHPPLTVGDQFPIIKVEGLEVKVEVKKTILNITTTIDRKHHHEEEKQANDYYHDQHYPQRTSVHTYNRFSPLREETRDL